MVPVLLPNGNIRVPKRAFDDNSRAVGDGFTELTPGDAEYDRYSKYMQTDAYKALAEAERNLLSSSKNAGDNTKEVSNGD